MTAPLFSSSNFKLNAYIHFTLLAQSPIPPPSTAVTFNSKYLLNVWGLDQMNYTRVIVLDPRGLVTNTSTLDQLFFCKSKFIYTAMPMGPLYSGMLALTPSSAALADMLRRIGQAASFDPDRGWFGQGYPCRTTRAYNISYSLRRDYESCFTDSRGGIMRERWMRYEYSSVAGFLWAYFNFVEGAGVDVVDTCLYSYHVSERTTWAASFLWCPLSWCRHVLNNEAAHLSLIAHPS